MIETIGDWEARRFSEEAYTEIAALPTVEPERVVQGDEAPGDGEADLVALLGRVTSGLAVQALWSRSTGRTYITLDIGGRTETFPVPADRLNDAFAHPYCYGGTLPIR